MVNHLHRPEVSNFGSKSNPIGQNEIDVLVALAIRDANSTEGNIYGSGALRILLPKAREIYDLAFRKRISELNCGRPRSG